MSKKRRRGKGKKATQLIILITAILALIEKLVSIIERLIK